MLRGGYLRHFPVTIIIIIYIYRALIKALSLSAHIVHINLNMIFCTHIEHSPTRTTHNPVRLCFVCLALDCHASYFDWSETVLAYFLFTCFY